MRKFLILLITLVLSTLWSAVANHLEPSSSISRGVELFDAGRWSDARHQFIKVREILPSTAVAERQMADYYLVMCAVQLGESDAERQMTNFIR